MTLDAGPHALHMERLRLKCAFCTEQLTDASASAIAWFATRGAEYGPPKRIVEEVRFEHNFCAMKEPISSVRYRFGRTLWLVFADPYRFLLPFIDQYTWEGMPRERMMTFMEGVLNMSRRELLEEMRLAAVVHVLAGGAPSAGEYQP